MRKKLEVRSFTFHTANVYSFRLNGYSGWAIFTICNKTGELSIQSDWGNWSYRWNTGALGQGYTLTKFIAKTDCDYLARKLCPNKTRPSEIETCKAFRKEIIRRRRRHDVKADVARWLWDEAREIATVYSERGADRASSVMSDEFCDFFEEWWFYLRDEDSYEFLMLREHLLPIFKERLEK